VTRRRKPESPHPSAYEGFYGWEGKPCAVVFPDDDPLENERQIVRQIIDTDREAYTGPLKARQAARVQ